MPRFLWAGRGGDYREITSLGWPEVHRCRVELVDHERRRRLGLLGAVNAEGDVNEWSLVLSERPWGSLALGGGALEALRDEVVTRIGTIESVSGEEGYRVKCI